jgi:L-asparaginase
MRQGFTLVSLLLFVGPTFNVLRRITLLHLGGTISGAAESATNTTHYEAGVVPIEDVIQDIKHILGKYANVDPKQFMSIDSVDMTLSDKLAITQRIKEELEVSDGVVVSTGTSNLNELLVHLSLSIKSNKPVVPTAAFKPHTAHDADGRQNIISATILASTPRWSEENNEVAAVVGSTIGLPWGLRKEDGYFDARFGSSMGTIKRGKLYLNDISDCYTTEKIDTGGYLPTDSLPEVSLLTSYSGFDGRLVRLAVDEGVRAFVITTYDDGYMPKEAAHVIEKVIEEYDIPIVAASYNPSIPVEHGRVKGMIPGLDLDPRQLRQLLTGHVLNGSDRTMIAKSIQRVSESMDCRARMSSSSGSILWKVSTWLMTGSNQ